ncbi:MAG: RNA polymerase sigma factor [Deltaproteobacteria bacterium]|nr:RNA polymerase sigma factor [Deltaproteobacteria bacterium]
MSEPTPAESLRAARAGDSRAFERVFGPHVPKLRGVLRRMVGHPDEVDDLAQQALLRAFDGLKDYREESSPSTWLCAIGARLAIDHLRQRRRWRERAQVIFAARCLESPELGGAVGGALSSPEFCYEVDEHIAYCFACVGRTLDPEPQAALVLRDVLGLTNAEAAKALHLSLSTLRHRLREARETMQGTYEGLCALVNKEGVCWQCAGLREAAPEGAKGPPVPRTIEWSRRLHVVREAALDRGQSAPMHDVFFRLTAEQEAAGLGDGNIETGCGRED